MLKATIVGDGWNLEVVWIWLGSETSHGKEDPCQQNCLLVMDDLLASKATLIPKQFSLLHPVQPLWAVDTSSSSSFGDLPA